MRAKMYISKPTNICTRLSVIRYEGVQMLPTCLRACPRVRTPTCTCVSCAHARPCVSVCSCAGLTGCIYIYVYVHVRVHIHLHRCSDRRTYVSSVPMSTYMRVEIRFSVQGVYGYTHTYVHVPMLKNVYTLLRAYTHVLMCVLRSECAACVRPASGLLFSRPKRRRIGAACATDCLPWAWRACMTYSAKQHAQHTEREGIPKNGEWLPEPAIHPQRNRVTAHPPRNRVLSPPQLWHLPATLLLLRTPSRFRSHSKFGTAVFDGQRRLQPTPAAGSLSWP